MPRTGSLAGRTISHYEIVAKLGEGGMGVVYKARDLRLERFVAIKFLGSHLAVSPPAHARFLREARAISTLNHPHIATIYEAGDSEEGPFLALEYLPGGTLQARIQGAAGSLSWHTIIEFALQLGEGLARVAQGSPIHEVITSTISGFAALAHGRLDRKENRMSTHVVHINVDADWHFTYTDENGHSAFSLKAKLGDWIKWTCNKPGFLVNFVDKAVDPLKNQSPFAQDQYHSLNPDQHTIPRQEIIRWRNVPFPYTVKLDSGQCDDPDIQVDNPSANLKWMLLAAAALVAGLVVAKQISED